MQTFRDSKDDSAADRRNAFQSRTYWSIYHHGTVTNESMRPVTHNPRVNIILFVSIRQHDDGVAAVACALRERPHPLCAERVIDLSDNSHPCWRFMIHSLYGGAARPICVTTAPERSPRISHGSRIRSSQTAINQTSHRHRHTPLHYGIEDQRLLSRLS